MNYFCPCGSSLSCNSNGKVYFGTITLIIHAEYLHAFINFPPPSLTAFNILLTNGIVMKLQSYTKALLWSLLWARKTVQAVFFFLLWAWNTKVYKLISAITELGNATLWELCWLHQLSSQHFTHLPAIQSWVKARVGTAPPQLQAFSPSSQ